MIPLNYEIEKRKADQKLKDENTKIKKNLQYQFTQAKLEKTEKFNAIRKEYKNKKSELENHLRSNHDKYEKSKELLNGEYDPKINELRERIHKCVISNSQLEMNWSYKVNTEFIPGVKSGKYKERYPEQRDVFVIPYKFDDDNVKDIKK